MTYRLAVLKTARQEGKKSEVVIAGEQKKTAEAEQPRLNTNARRLAKACD